RIKQIGLNVKRFSADDRRVDAFEHHAPVGKRPALFYKWSCHRQTTFGCSLIKGTGLFGRLEFPVMGNEKSDSVEAVCYFLLRQCCHDCRKVVPNLGNPVIAVHFQHDTVAWILQIANICIDTAHRVADGGNFDHLRSLCQDWDFFVPSTSASSS